MKKSELNIHCGGSINLVFIIDQPVLIIHEFSGLNINYRDSIHLVFIIN